MLAVTVALLLATLTGRSDLCIAGVFGAGKTRSLAILQIALSCKLEDFCAVPPLNDNPDIYSTQAEEFEEQVKKLKAIIREREKEIEDKKMVVKNKDMEISELKESFEREKEKMKQEVSIPKDNHF